MINCGDMQDKLLNKKWISFGIFLIFTILVLLYEFFAYTPVDFNAQNMAIFAILLIFGIVLFFIQYYYRRKYPQYLNIVELLREKYRWLYRILWIVLILVMIYCLFLIYLFFTFIIGGDPLGLTRFV